MRGIFSVTGFFIRHFMVGIFAIFFGWLVWSGCYVVLLGVALVFDSGAGGPLAWPGGLALVGCVCAGVGWGVFAPASGFGLVICRWTGLPRLAAIPVVFVGAFLLSWFWGRLFMGWNETLGWFPIKGFILYLSVPLGVYWWVTEGPGALFETFRSWFQRRTRLRGREVKPLRGF